MTYNYYFILFKLLKMGIPYKEIFAMSESEIKHLIAVDAAIEEINQEHMATQSYK